MVRWHGDSTVRETALGEAHVLSRGRRSDGWMLAQALLLILGGMAIVGYVMIALANADG